MKVTLATVATAEYEEFFAMLVAYHRELDQYENSEVDPVSPEDKGRASLDDIQTREFLWIIVNEERAGLIIASTLPDWPDATRLVASIIEFYVLPEHRRQGVGRAAIEALLSDHSQRGTALVEASILYLNEPARAFWCALGFDFRSVLTARKP